MLPQKNNQSDAPTEEGLRLLIQFGQIEGVQATIDAFKLPFKIVKRDDKFVLEDTVQGADLWLKKFITEDFDTIAMKNDARKLSKIDDEVLILGETGTGKELIARSLIGDRTGGFYRINCAAMPKELIESELFGHKAGAFTGATVAKPGMMKAAKDGVLFLDEIGDLALETQSKLLNALQPVDGKRYIRPVGGNDEVEINCRIVCATHRDIKKMVMVDKSFRMDLYARISTFELNIKPLRERKMDVFPIIKEIGFLLKQEAKAAEFVKVYTDKIVNDELDLSLNVRSLEQAIKRYSILGRV